MIVARVALVLGICAVALGAAGLAGSASLPGFHSPTGNIKCLFVPGPPRGMMLCQIKRADYAKRLVAYCGSPPIGVDWAGFTLGATRKATVACSGGVLYNPDTQKPVYVNLPYGRTWRHGVFTCSSRVTGITCRSRTGHGLFVSREAYRLW